MTVYVYENHHDVVLLEPISLTRPGFDLRCGALTFLERIERLLPDATLGLFVREELEDLTREKFPRALVNPQNVTEGLWLNGTFVWESEHFEDLNTSINSVFRSGERVVGAFLDDEKGQSWVEGGGPVHSVLDESLESKQISGDLAAYLWNIVDLNGDMIPRDAPFFDLGAQMGEVDDGVHLLNPSSIHIGKGLRVKAGAFLDAEGGPIIVGQDVTVLPGAFLEGPLVVGDHCLIKAGAKVYGGTSLGPGCKIGGEVTESIFQGWSNKQHDGFLGHAYVGEWVNLGADTNNSDLKNNYSPVKVTVNGQVVNTGSLFVGVFMGDHSKTAINTAFNTGTSVGPACNIVGSRFPPRAIPPFSWVVDGRIRTHLFEKFVETAQTVKKRRNAVLSSHEETLYRRIFQGRTSSDSSDSP